MIKTNLEFVSKDLNELLAMFDGSEHYNVNHIFSEKEDRVVNTIVVNGKAYVYGNLIGKIDDEIERKRLYKRYAKLSLYKAISRFSGVSLPWGALTGVRPTKLAYQQIKKGENFQSFLRDVMLVSDEKIELISKVVENQKPYIDTTDLASDLFVFIPFCPTRCKYCSFITADVKRASKYVDEYVDKLVEEINKSAPLIKNLRSIYIGGGTPVALSNENLEKVLSAIDKINTGVEYTVEAGRADRITKENLALFKKYRVTRLCVNPQTFNDKTLTVLHRNHSAMDVINAYNLAKNDFIINMDFIAGLEGETFEDFKYSIDKAISLNPDNITVHTLSIKNGSELSTITDRVDAGEVDKMVSYAIKSLTDSGYEPYYLYRQKYMAGNLENIGFSKPNKQCIYNIDIMEETTDIVACGAGAISKRVNNKNNIIERVGAPKDVPTYIDKLENIILEKQELFN